MNRRPKHSSRLLQSLPYAAWFVLLGALFFAAIELPDGLVRFRSDLDVLRLRHDRLTQYRQVVGAELYDALVLANRTLPREAAVLLVTAGTDVRHWEYTAFHRALYHLAPRPVWWAAPVERDGTWESRWWTPAALSPDALVKHAAAVGATHVLSFGIQPAVLPGERLMDLPARGELNVLPGALAPILKRAPAPDIDVFWPLRLIASVAITLLAGHLVVESIAPPDLKNLGVLRLAVDWLLGAGVLSLGLFWMGSLGVPLAAQVWILSGLVLSGALILRFWRSMRTDQGGLPTPTAWMWLTRGLSVWVFSLIGLVTIRAVGQPLWVWDSWVTWGMRARLIYLEGGIPSGLYSDLSRLVTHLSYPLLVPLTEVWTYIWIGEADDRFAGVQAVLFYATLLGLFFTSLRRSARSHQASEVYTLAVLLGLASIPYIGGLAGIVFADIPLAAYTLGTAIFLRRWLVDGSTTDLALTIALAGFLPWTKSEGFLLLIVLAGIGLLAGGFTRRAWATGLAMVVSAAVVSGPWYARVAAAGISEPAYKSLTWDSLAANIHRLPRIVALFGARGVQLEWHFLWIGISLAGAYLLLARRPIQSFFLSAVVIYLGMTILTFIFSDYEPLEAHILSSADRLMAHVAPLATLWLAEFPFRTSSYPERTQ